MNSTTKEENDIKSVSSDKLIDRLIEENKKTWNAIKFVSTMITTSLLDENYTDVKMDAFFTLADAIWKFKNDYFTAEQLEMLRDAWTRIQTGCIKAKTVGDELNRRELKYYIEDRKET